MRIILGQAHREAIQKKIQPGSKVLEWGSGGSTLWFADRLPERASLTSIDHDAVWHERVTKCIGSRPNIRILLARPCGPIGANATIDEEDPTYLNDYIHAVDGEKFDIIFVDGVARGSCMAHAKSLLKEDGLLFLHDAHRTWYDEAKSLYFEHGTIGSCPEYPGPTLWWGGLQPEQPRFSIGALPIIVNCYTENTPYAQEVENLRRSIDAFGLESRIVAVKNLGSWEENCAFKAQFIHDIYFREDRPLLWIDADAVIRDYPLLVAGAEADFAIHKAHRWQFASGTVYFNRTESAEQLLRDWLRRCLEQPHIWDQIHLDLAWEALHARRPLRTQWLPQTYTKIFDLAWEDRYQNIEAYPVVEHFQASRRFKNTITQGDSHIMPQPPNELIAARIACRARESFYDERFCLMKSPPGPDLWSASSIYQEQHPNILAV